MHKWEHGSLKSNVFERKVNCTKRQIERNGDVFLEILVQPFILML